MSLIADCGCMSWLGALYSKIEDMHHDIDDIMRQNVAKNIEDEVMRTNADDENVRDHMQTLDEKNDNNSYYGHCILKTPFHDEVIKEDFFSACSGTLHENSLEIAKKNERKQNGNLSRDLTQLYQNNKCSLEMSEIERKNSTIKYVEDADWEVI